MMLNNGMEHGAVYTPDFEASGAFYKALGYDNVFYDFEMSEEDVKAAGAAVSGEEASSDPDAVTGARLVMLQKGNCETGMMEIIHQTKADGTLAGYTGLLGFSYKVDDVEETYNLLREKGYKVSGPPTGIPVPGRGIMKLFTVQSPEDITIEVFQSIESK